MVWNGLLLELLPLVTYWPLTKGMVWPTKMLATSLSRVSRFGVDSTLEPPLDFKARASTLRSMTRPTPGIFTAPLTRPRLRPWGNTSILLVAVLTRLVPPRLTPPITPLPARLPACHCTPNSLASSSLTSTIRLSITTWARRWSSWSMTSRRLRYSGSGALISKVLVVASAWMVTPPAENATLWSEAWAPPAARVPWALEEALLAVLEPLLDVLLPLWVPVWPFWLLLLLFIPPLLSMARVGSPLPSPLSLSPVSNPRRAWASLPAWALRRYTTCRLLGLLWALSSL